MKIEEEDEKEDEDDFLVRRHATPRGATRNENGVGLGLGLRLGLGREVGIFWSGRAKKKIHRKRPENPGMRCSAMG
jgi:hypothetical protein